MSLTLRSDAVVVVVQPPVRTVRQESLFSAFSNPVARKQFKTRAVLTLSQAWVPVADVSPFFLLPPRIFGSVSFVRSREFEIVSSFNLADSQVTLVIVLHPFSLLCQC